LPRVQRNSVEQQFVLRDAEEESGISSGGQRILQFVPGGFELTFRTLVIKAVHPGVLDQDVEAVHKGLRRGRTRALRCLYAGDKRPPTVPFVRSSVSRNGKGSNVTEVIVREFCRESCVCRRKEARERTESRQNGKIKDGQPLFSHVSCSVPGLLRLHLNGGSNA
jgi:hypothetical protein